MTGMMRRSLALCCLFISLPGLTYQISWMTDGLVPWTFTCPVNMSIKKIITMSFNYQSDNLIDHQWNFTCTNVPTGAATALSNCEWSGYANSFTSYINYQCPNDDVMTGIRTTYDRATQDRIFDFMCCGAGDYVTYGCYYTEYLNSFNSPVYYRIPDGYILRGLHSPFSTTSHDRRFSLLLCKLSKLAVIVG